MPRRPKRREPAATVDYTDSEGNVLTLRESLSSGSIRKIAEGQESAARRPSTTTGGGARRCSSSGSP